MSVRRAALADLGTAVEIYAYAREFMKRNGNPTQWGEDHPPKELVLSDIESGRLFLLEEGGEAYGVFAFLPDGDEIYNSIDGRWLSDSPHAAVHRVASNGKRRGVVAECMRYCTAIRPHIRIDTHPQNRPMQVALKKLGFVECGTLGELLAFELVSS